jgi:hypothetical protein
MKCHLRAGVSRRPRTPTSAAFIEDSLDSKLQKLRQTPGRTMLTVESSLLCLAQLCLAHAGAFAKDRYFIILGLIGESYSTAALSAVLISLPYRSSLFRRSHSTLVGQSGEAMARRTQMF